MVGRHMVDVHTLICHRDMALGLRCLPSLLRYSHDPVRLVVHDDGTLDQDDVERLSAGLPGARLIPRAEADDHMADKLRRHPMAAQFRRRHPFGLKLFDTTLLDEGGVMRYCDTDVMFFRPHRDLFELHDADGLFMADTHDAYSLRSWQMWRGGVRVVDRSNAGLMAFRTSRFDLDRAEWVLKQPVHPRFLHFVEQTTWAVLAAPLDVRQWSPSQVRIVAAGVRRPPTLIAGHYIGPFRGLLDGLSDPDFASPAESPVHLVSRLARTIGPVQYGFREAKRLVASTLGPQPKEGHDAYEGWPTADEF